MISKLPNELTARICSFLAKDDLAATRLVDKQTSATAIREFAVRYFTTLIIMVSRYSLQALIDICSHPVFGGYVRNITFSAIRAEAEVLSEHVPDLKRGLDSNSMADFGSAEKGIQLFLTHCRENVELHNDEGAQYIARAFLQLDERNIPLKITVNSWPCCDAIGTKRACQSGAGGWHEITSLTVKMVLNGAKQAGCCLESLELLRNAHEFDGESDHISLKDKDAGPLRQLKKFAFHQTGFDCDGSDDWDSIEQVVQQTECLEVLEIDFFEQNDRIKAANTPEAYCFLASQELYDLREISFSRMIIEEKALLELFDQCKETLRKLRLTLIGIQDGTCEHVLTWIQRNLTLQDLELKDLFIPDWQADHDEFSITRWCFTQAFCLHSGREVRSGIAQFLDC